jgi:L-alanine-DL-glutamate epimerase-like enolase superfamily enzyme
VKITDIGVETAIVSVEHQFVWRKGLPGSGTEQDTIRIVAETDDRITGEAQGPHGAWCEEPMREFNIDAYRRLHDKVDIALLSGETSDGAHYNIVDFIASDACDLVRTSTHYKGGITGAMRIAHLAESFNMRAEVHGGGLANLAIACAIPNPTYYESLVRANPIIVEDSIGPDGCISTPKVPGIGWETEVT